MGTNMSDFSPEQREAILKALCSSLYDRYRALLIELESEKGIRGEYGTTQMTNIDRRNNRLVADLIITNNGVPVRDTESHDWLKEVMCDANVWHLK